jgi:TMEM199 family protein
MARLRKEEEARAYQRMVDGTTSDSGPLRFSTRHAHIIGESARGAADQEDDITYSDVNRQIALIFNVLVSIIACGIAIWVAARHWQTPQRLAVSMTGSLIVGVAEVVIYTGYLRRLGEAKEKEKTKKEVISIEESWIIEGNSSSSQSNNSTTRLRATKGRLNAKS